MATLTKYLMPRRGTATVMASKTSLVLKKGEFFIEAPAEGIGKGHSRIKIGDGETTYTALPYAIGDTENDVINFTEDTSTTTSQALAKVVSGAALKVDIAALKQAINLLVAKQASTYAFGTVTVNGANIAASSTSDKISVSAGENVTLDVDPETKAVTVSAKDTTYENATTSVAGLESAADKAKLDGIEAGAQVNQNAYANVKVGDTGIAAASTGDTISFAGSGSVTVTPDATTKTITISATDTTYENATTTTAGLESAADKAKLDGIEPGAQVNTITGVKGGAETSYRVGEVNITKANIGLGNVDDTADADKNVATAKTLATARNISLSGAVTGTATAFDGSADVEIPVTSVDGTKITGVIPLSSIPSGAQERLVVVADEEAMLALTKDNVQAGDTVKRNDNGIMYYVKDESKLGTADAFAEYAAGTAASVDWVNVQNKPATYAPSEHTHLYAASTTAGGPATSALKADEATKATQDGNGKVIADTYVKNITAEGTTVTFTYGNGSTASFETQDNNTEYADATATVHGLMSTDDKKKLDAIEESADANQNAFSYVAVGDQKISAGAVTSTLNVAAGDNVTVTPDAGTNTLTIAAKDTTYENATTTTAGLESAADKAKLDGISEGANKIEVTPALTSGTKIATVSVDGTAVSLFCETDTDTHWDGKLVVADAADSATDVTKALANGQVFLNYVENGVVKGSHKISGSNTTTVTTDAAGNLIITGMGTDEVATESVNGLMSAADKTVLDTLATQNSTELYMDFGEEV